MDEGFRSILERFVELTKKLYFEDDRVKRSQLIRQLRALSLEAEDALQA
jgi:hypothetical protein